MRSSPARVPVLDPDQERRRHALWQRVAQLRAQLQTEPELQAHHELGQALAELRALDSINKGGGDA